MTCLCVCCGRLSPPFPIQTHQPAHLEPDVLDGEGDGGHGGLGRHHHLQVGGVQADAEVQHDLFLGGNEKLIRIIDVVC
jgi:hypothetical protein